MNESYGTNKNIELIFDLSPVLLDITKAVPLGLIVNEVLTNAFKYAFDDNNSKPKLEIHCFHKNDKTLVRIKDNGPGMKKSDLKHGGMGHELIYNLCKQIGGEINFNFTNGVEMTLLF